MDKDIERLGKERLGRQKKHKKWMMLTIILSVIALSASVYNLIQPAHAIEIDGVSLADFSGYLSGTVKDTSYKADTNTISANITTNFSMTLDEFVADGLNYYYELPDGISVDSGSIGSQNAKIVYDKSNTSVEAFTYYYLEKTDENGKTKYYMIFNFLQSYQDYCRTKNTTNIEGSFNLNVEFGSGSDKKEDGTYKVTIGKSELTVSPDNVTYPPNKNIKRDISVSKTASNNGGFVYDGDNAYLEFTVRISTEQGTSGDVNVSDVFTYNDLVLSGVEIESIKKGSTDIDVNNYQPTPDTTETGKYKWNFTLPALDAGEYYTITYRYPVTIPASATANLTGSNTVTVSTGGEGDHYSVEDSKTASVDVSKTLKTSLGKYGYAYGDVITWTITVNASQADINEYTLTDEAFSSFAKGDIEVKCTTASQDTSYEINENNGKVTGIKFKNTAGSSMNVNTYTVTYKQKIADLNLQDGAVVSNTAKFSKDGGDSLEAKYDVTINSAWLEKKADKGTVTETNGNKYLTITWTSTYYANGSGIKLGTVYTDTLGTGNQDYEYQWFTYAQIKSIYENLTTHFTDNSIDFYVYELGSDNTKLSDRVLYSDVTDTSKHFYKYEVEFLKNIPADTADFTLTYESTAIVTESLYKNLNNGIWNFSNSAQLADHNAYGQYNYEKTVVKSDGSSSNLTQTDPTEHTLKTGGEVSWIIKTVLTGDDLKDAVSVTFKDDLPADLTLAKVEFGSDLSSLVVAYSNNEEVTTADHDSNFTISGSTYSSSLVQATFTKQSASTAKYLYVKITCKLGESFFDEGNVVTIQNTATITGNGNKTISSNPQTQTITKDETIPTVDNVKKGFYYRTSEAGDGRLNYAITINPGAKTLNNENDLTLVDELKYYEVMGYPYNGIYSLSLLMDTVTLYKDDGTGQLGLDADGKVVHGQKVDNNKIWSYTYKETTTGDSWDDGEHYKLNRITVTVPDKTAYILVYTYKMSSSVMNQEITIDHNHITNSVTLTGTATDTDSVTASDTWELSSHKIDISSNSSFTFWKVETGRYNVTLPGAVFSLYKYNGETYEDTEIRYTTDGDGKFTVNKEGGSETYAYEYNTAYYLVETTPPDGYAISDDNEPYYFYFSDPNVTDASATSVMPDDFKKTATDFTTDYSGTVIENAPAITIKKVWTNTNDDPLTGVDPDLTVNAVLYQLASGVKTGVQYDVTLDSEHSWTSTFKGLPTASSDGTIKYTYVVEEVKVTKNGEDVTDNYVVSYDNNGGISIGTITITNKLVTKYELPQTGGSGRTILYMFGGLLALGAGFVLIYRKHKII